MNENQPWNSSYIFPHVDTPKPFSWSELQSLELKLSPETVTSLTNWNLLSGFLTHRLL